MIEIRVTRPCRREFLRDVYHPGVISLSRIVWGSVGGGLILAIVCLLSSACSIGLLLPPLAATCFINATCTYLRVARPKSVIVGHFASTVGGLLGVYAGQWALGGSSLAAPAKLGLAVLLASTLMQALDADHPPAAATAAIPAILPLPAPDLVLPLHMAWGGVLAVVLSIAWNRVWFECPAPDESGRRSWLNLGMDKPDIAGTGICIFATALMSARPWSGAVYIGGLWLLLAGVCVLSFHHFFSARLVTFDSAAGPGGPSGDPRPATDRMAAP